MGSVKCVETTPDTKCRGNYLSFPLWYVVFYWYNVEVQGKIGEVKWLWQLINIPTILFFLRFIYSFRERERQAEREAGSMQGARLGTRSQNPRIALS